MLMQKEPDHSKDKKARPLDLAFRLKWIPAYFAAAASFFHVRLGALVMRPFFSARVETRT